MPNVAVMAQKRQDKKSDPYIALHKGILVRFFLWYIKNRWAIFYTYSHKVLTYEEYRAVTGVFQNIDPHPLSTQRVCPPPAPKAGGVHTRRAVRGWRVKILQDARHRIGLLQYHLSTLTAMRSLLKYDSPVVFQLKRSGLCIVVSTAAHTMLF
jgi:hypothetical protein